MFESLTVSVSHSSLTCQKVILCWQCIQAFWSRDQACGKCSLYPALSGLWMGHRLSRTGNRSSITSQQLPWPVPLVDLMTQSMTSKSLDLFRDWNCAFLALKISSHQIFLLPRLLCLGLYCPSGINTICELRGHKKLFCNKAQTIPSNVSSAYMLHIISYIYIYIKEKEHYDFVSPVSFDSFKCYSTGAGVGEAVLNIALW